MPGAPVTWLNQFTVNLTTTNDQSDPEIVQLANGNILVSWTSNDPTAPGNPAGPDILGQIFDPMGNRIGGEIRLNNDSTVDNEFNADLAALPDGGFIMVYTDLQGGQPRVRMEVYDADGTQRIGEGGIVRDLGAGINVVNPHVAVSSSTSALVAYQIDTGGGFGISFKIFNPSTNTFSAELPLLIGTDMRDPDVEVLSNGNYVITATQGTVGDNSISYRIVNATGGNVLGHTTVTGTAGDGFNDNEASVTALAGGGFVISFTDRDASDTDVAYRVYNATGTQTGSGFVNGSGSITNNNNESVVSGLSDGTFVIVYDNDEAGVMTADHFDATGSFLGTFNFAGGGTEPAIRDLGDGRFVVSWEPNAGGDIFMEILDTRDFVNPEAVYTFPNQQIGTIFNDTFVADVDSDITHGHLGNDDITDTGSSGNNQYFGDEGNDILRVTTAIDSDTWNGGSGNDTIDWSGASPSVSGATFNLGAGTATLGLATEIMVGFENLIGTNNNDSIVGTAGNNVLTALGGNDTINGHAGADTMFGGTGDDIYIVAAAGDTTIENAGQGTDTVRSYIDWMLSDNVERLELQGAGNLNGTGNTLNNTLVGNSGANTLNGGDGNDFISAGVGNDTLVGGAGNDTLIGAAGSDILNGGTGNDRFDYDLVSHSPAGPALRDSIVGGFAHGFDRIDLATIDANTLVGGNQAFSFIGAAAFSGVAGQLRYSTFGGHAFIDADVNGDSTADMQIFVAGTHWMTGTDFIL
ncbi:calcium-binding protein [Allomesorhizobium alhagi]|jgi:Ca2+-binding RTX toxin-like protein|uniref:Iron-regulated protein FrpC, putative n=1 Tax=Mesorhizobium alhagi CCNWXJ12-2 TaxID=1107882 RepID=H0HR86_9HYPH|nr:calcium-binding protein [Mesorhizobium alhagi]EHK56769.1 iron-regulated protein FrpC, putative [Mesorhizobium alhagi CCNWXJ12-2]